MRCLEETSAICRVCLIGNVKMYGIKNRQLQVLYEVLASTELDVVVGVDVTLCYICYSQLERIRKFSIQSQKSSKILKSLEECDFQIISQEAVECNFLGTQPKLTISTIPPISINSNSNIITQVPIKEEHIETEDSTSIEDREMLPFNLNDKTETLLDNIRPTPSLNQTEIFAGAGRKRKACTHVVSHNKPTGVKKGRNKVTKSQINNSEFFQLSKNIALPCKASVNVDEKEPNNSEAIKVVKNLMPITNTKRPIAKKKVLFLNNLSNDQRKAIIEKTIHELIELSKQEKKNPMIHPRPRPLPWCIRSQTLLVKLIKLSGSEETGAMLLADRVLPLFAEGFARVPSLKTMLETAFHKNINVLENEQQNDNNVFESMPQIPIALQNVQKVLSSDLFQNNLVPVQIEKPSSSSKPVTSPAKTKTPVLLPHPNTMNSLSVSNVIKGELNRTEFILYNNMVMPIIDQPRPLITGLIIANINNINKIAEVKYDNVIMTKNQRNAIEKKSTDMNTQANSGSSSSLALQDKKTEPIMKKMENARIIKNRRIAPKPWQNIEKKSPDMNTRVNSATSSEPCQNIEKKSPDMNTRVNSATSTEPCQNIEKKSPDMNTRVNSATSTEPCQNIEKKSPDMNTRVNSATSTEPCQNIEKKSPDMNTRVNSATSSEPCQNIEKKSPDMNTRVNSATSSEPCQNIEKKSPDMNTRVNSATSTEPCQNIEKKSPDMNTRVNSATSSEPCQNIEKKISPDMNTRVNSATSSSSVLQDEDSKPEPKIAMTQIIKKLNHPRIAPEPGKNKEEKPTNMNIQVSLKRKMPRLLRRTRPPTVKLIKNTIRFNALESVQQTCQKSSEMLQKSCLNRME